MDSHKQQQTTIIRAYGRVVIGILEGHFQYLKTNSQGVHLGHHFDLSLGQI